MYCQKIILTHKKDYAIIEKSDWEDLLERSFGSIRCAHKRKFVMRSLAENFVNTAIKCGALQFGNFTLKSGRRSPFFFNAAKYSSGKYIHALATDYTITILNNFDIEEIDVLFGPAYKGISLAATVAYNIYASDYDERSETNIRFCSDRKEAKDHGDKGSLVGAEIHDGDRVLMIEDVTTTGKSMDETIPLLKSIADVEIVGLVVALDRNERGRNLRKTAQEELAERYGIKIASIVTMPEVIEAGVSLGYITSGWLMELDEYYNKYGVCR